jgi:uncharacterized membrane protein
MQFVYLHAALFAVWCATGLFGIDPYPFNFLTVVVSLEAIFLSTFILISQNKTSAIDRENVLKDLSVDTEALEVLKKLLSSTKKCDCEQDGSSSYDRPESS